MLSKQGIVTRLGVPEFVNKRYNEWDYDEGVDYYEPELADIHLIYIRGFWISFHGSQEQTREWAFGENNRLSIRADITPWVARSGATLYSGQLAELFS